MTNQSLENYNFKQKKGSFLLNELSKLQIKNEESIIDHTEKLSYLSNYIHVKRDIETIFFEKVKEISEKDSNHLILLCGNVGDGKSHLLSRLKTKNPELYDKFKVFGDASESYSPKKTNIDTLGVNILKPFKDNFNENEYSSDSERKPIILAINLGVLTDFLESEYIGEYTNLKQVIESSKIFDKDVISSDIDCGNISIITFTDYNLFEFDITSPNRVKSEFISQLFSKITCPNEKINPFYKAYRMDKENNYTNSFIYNYELICDSNVQNILINYLIKLILKYKKLISTRIILHFIYNILVPSEIKSNNDNFKEYIQDLLPNLLFGANNHEKTNGENNSDDIRNLFNQFDPTLIHNNDLDDFIIKLNNTHDIKGVLEKYINLSKIPFIETYIENNGNKIDISDGTFIRTLIRFSLFFGKINIKRHFDDETFIRFVEYLYNYNIKENDGYKDLFEEVRNAIFKFYGEYNGNICIEKLTNYSIYKKLKLFKRYDPWEGIDKKKISNRFKLQIKIFYSPVKSEKGFSLSIDYLLYENLVKINNGYKFNHAEKDNLIMLRKFIDDLILNEKDSDELIIIHHHSNKKFRFDYDTYENESFNFERV